MEPRKWFEVAGGLCLVLVAVIMLSVAPSARAHNAVYQGAIVIGTGGGCDRSPDCAAFRMSCDPDRAPMDGTTTAIIDLKSYIGHAIHVSSGPADRQLGAGGAGQN